jgi:hypothetical protein
MPISNKSLDSTLSVQESLFDIPIAEGALDLSMTFRDTLSRSLTACKDSRYQVAAKISELTKRNMSKDMLDKYTSSNVNYELKAVDLPAFCAVCRTIEPLRALVTPLDCDVVNPEDSKQLKLAKLLQQQKTLAMEIARTEIELGVRGGKG